MNDDGEEEEVQEEEKLMRRKKEVHNPTLQGPDKRVYPRTQRVYPRTQERHKRVYPRTQEDIQGRAPMCGGRKRRSHTSWRVE